MKCSIVIVNYRSKKYLENCLSSIENQLTNKGAPLFPFEVIVINNDQEPLTVGNEPKLDIRIIENKKNVGFGMANNLGASQALGEYLFFLNPDTILLDDSLRTMIYYLDKHLDVGIIGPRIFCHYRKSSQPWTCGTKTDLMSIIFKNTINKPWNKKHAINVDWVSGTALLTRKELFEEIGGFDKKFFMYFEDQDLCLRIKQAGKAVIYYPHSTIIHYDGKSWNSSFLKKKVLFSNLNHIFLKNIMDKFNHSF